MQGVSNGHPALDPDQLVAMHGGEVGRFIAALVDNADTVNDLVQETFVRGWRALAVVQPLAMGAWLKGIALNVVREHRRSGWRRRVELVADPPALAAPACDQPDQTVLAADRAGQIRRAISHLPPAQAEAVRLHFLLGETYESMEALLGVPRSTLRSRVLAAGERLRAELAHLEEAP